MSDSRAGEPARWWAVRPTHSRKPATYTCPFCRHRLHAMSEHLLIAPEGDTARRRHAHTECVRAERQAGRLPTLDEFRRATSGPRRSLFSRLVRRGGAAD
jgi:hypothetical protein